MGGGGEGDCQSFTDGAGLREMVGEVASNGGREVEGWAADEVVRGNARRPRGGEGRRIGRVGLQGRGAAVREEEDDHVAA